VCVCVCVCVCYHTNSTLNLGLLLCCVFWTLVQVIRPQRFWLFFGASVVIDIYMFQAISIGFAAGFLFSVFAIFWLMNKYAKIQARKDMVRDNQVCGSLSVFALWREYSVCGLELTFFHEPKKKYEEAWTELKESEASSYAADLKIIGEKCSEAKAVLKKGIHIHTDTQTHTHTTHKIHKYVYIFIHTYTYICMYVYTHTHTHTHTHV